MNIDTPPPTPPPQFVYVFISIKEMAWFPLLMNLIGAFFPSAFSPLIKGILRNQEVFLKRAQSTPPSS